MVTRKHILAVLSFLLIAAFALSACQPVVQTVTVVETVEVEVPVEVVTTQEVTVIETQIVEVEKGAFTTPHPILSDLKVRQAMAYCTNKLELIQSVYPLITPEQQESLVMNTFIPRTQWAYAGDENITIYPFDPEKGMALLEEAGWVMDEGTGFRAKDGEALSLKFTTTTAAFRQTWAAVFEQQMANCGIQIVRLHAPASWWFGDTTGLARRDFELGAYAWVGQVDPGGRTLYACDQIPLPENGWDGQNDMGWCNEKARRWHQERQQHPAPGRAQEVVHRSRSRASPKTCPPSRSSTAPRPSPLRLTWRALPPPRARNTTPTTPASGLSPAGHSRRWASPRNPPRSSPG